jgi:hypothetical protein
LESIELLQGLAPPIDMLERYFGVHGWRCERHGDEEIIAAIEGSWTRYQLRALWREEDQVLQLVGLLDLKSTEAKRPAIYETLSLINEQLWLGHFEMWSGDGSLLFRHAALVDGDDDARMTFAQAEMLVEAAIDECERYYPVFNFVLESDQRPRDALAAALIDTHGEA